MEIGGEVVGSSEPVVGAYHIQQQTAERTLDSQQIAKLRSKWIEYKSTNDLLVYHFTVPTINPEIEIQVPKELEYSVEFGTPAENIEKLQYTSRKRLVGNLLSPSTHDCKMVAESKTFVSRCGSYVRRSCGGERPISPDSR
jgi:hypothetical protein